MQAKLGVAASFFLLSVTWGASPDQNPEIVLSVAAGTPLRLYLTERIPKKAGLPVEARLLDPLWAYDRLVVPTGVVVFGTVRRVEPVDKRQRWRAILGGDFTPLRNALVDFTAVEMPDGRKISIETVASPGLGSLVKFGALTRVAAAQQNTGVFGTAKQKAKGAMHAELDRVKEVAGIAKAPDKKERLYDFAMTKLPYHPQYIRKGTRFDAELRDPLMFGTAALPPGALAMLGAEPAAGSVAHARLTTTLDSASSEKGEPVEARLVAPLFSSDHHLVMPESTRLLGSVVVAKPARWFHRGGNLRFTFSRFDIPAAPVLHAETNAIAADRPAPALSAFELQTRATLQAAESDGKSPLKIDGEGGVQAKESKKRFIAPAISMLIARAAADNDPIRDNSGAITGQSQNVGGRTLGGASGFGLLGIAAAQSSRYVGTAFGFYGMAWSVYSNIISRGFDVVFPQNTMVDVKFNTRPPAAPPKPGGD